MSLVLIPPVRTEQNPSINPETACATNSLYLTITHPACHASVNTAAAVTSTLSTTATHSRIAQKNIIPIHYHLNIKHDVGAVEQDERRRC
jgi:hypothetical protein